MTASSASPRESRSSWEHPDLNRAEAGANGGSSFKTVKSKAVRGRSLRDVDVASGALVAFGRTTLAVSKDNGNSWEKLKRPKGEKLIDADFLGASKGYALSNTGAVFKTSNGGEKWKVLKGVGTDAGTGISCSTPRAGYVAVDRFGREGFGYVLRTRNGGKSWQPQLIAPSEVDVWDARATGYAVMPDGSGFFATTTGGQAGESSKLTLDVAKSKSSNRAKRVKVIGRLSPAEGGEEIVVSNRKAGNPRWHDEVLTAASNGRFTAKFKIRKKGENKRFVVAQWSGDDERAGTGSRALTIRSPR
jgi:photosystem II stability/assembly factor-like uncharacterized protein